MADGNNLTEEAVSLLKKYSAFKTDYMSKLDWKRSEWEAQKLVQTKLHFIVKNTSFWFQNLKEVENPKALVITLFKEGLDLPVNPKEFLMAFKSQFGLAGLNGFSITRNKFFLSLFFETVEQRQFAANNFCVYNQSFIINSDWFHNAKPTEFKIIWLPPTIDIIDIQTKLENYCELVNLFREMIDIGDGDSLPTGVVTGSLYLNKGLQAQEIPHILGFDGFNGLLIIYKRQPLCLNCNETGHISTNCPTPYCTTCRVKKDRMHKCISRTDSRLYSQVANNTLIDEDTLWNHKLVKSMDKINLLQKLQDELKLQNTEDYNKSISRDFPKLAVEQKQTEDLDSPQNFTAPELSGSTSLYSDITPMDIQQTPYKRSFEEMTQHKMIQGKDKPEGEKIKTDNKKSNMSLRSQVKT